tara:strand:- start:58 stop:885 length:828 start_codon:yes stop_codon:yes gene_type:complete
MKIIYYSILAISLTSCGNETDAKEDKIKEVENKGEVVVKNGKDKEMTIQYTCLGCRENLKSLDVFYSIIKEANTRTKNRLNYPLSYVPKDFDIAIIEEDSLYYFDNNKRIENTFQVMVTSNYIAKNSYGNELEGDGTIFFYLKDNTIVDLDDQIKLSDIKYEDKIINRSLELYQGKDEIRIRPNEDKGFIVKSSLGCVDEGTWLVVRLENKEEIKLVSWNDFNCDGTSYFKPFNEEQIKIINESKIASISILDDESAAFIVPQNESDYFMQLVNL